MKVYETELWTSRLTVFYNSEKDIKYYIDILILEIETIYSKFNPNSQANKYHTFDAVNENLSSISSRTSITMVDIYNFANYKGTGNLDFTGLLKGYFIECLSKFLEGSLFIINFGGDGSGYWNKGINIYDGNMTHVIPAYCPFSFCTSVNGSKRRGMHIQSVGDCMQATVISKAFNATLCDMYATQTVAGIEVPKKPGIKIFSYSKSSDIDNIIVGGL